MIERAAPWEHSALLGEEQKQDAVDGDKDILIKLLGAIGLRLELL